MSEPAHANVIPLRRPPCDPRTGEVLEDAQAFIDKIWRERCEYVEFFENERDEKTKAIRSNKTLKTQLENAKEKRSEEALLAERYDPVAVRKVIDFHYEKCFGRQRGKYDRTLSGTNGQIVIWFLNNADWDPKDFCFASIGFAANDFYREKGMTTIQAMASTRLAEFRKRVLDGEKMLRWCEAGKQIRGVA